MTGKTMLSRRLCRVCGHPLHVGHLCMVRVAGVKPATKPCSCSYRSKETIE